VQVIAALVGDVFLILGEGNLTLGATPRSSLASGKGPLALAQALGGLLVKSGRGATGRRGRLDPMLVGEYHDGGPSFRCCGAGLRPLPRVRAPGRLARFISTAIDARARIPPPAKAGDPSRDFYGVPRGAPAARLPGSERLI